MQVKSEEEVDTHYKDINWLIQTKEGRERGEKAPV